MLEDPQATDKPERMFNRNIKLSDWRYTTNSWSLQKKKNAEFIGAA
jgi:hypothetical protein